MFSKATDSRGDLCFSETPFLNIFEVFFSEQLEHPKIVSFDSKLGYPKEGLDIFDILNILVAF